MNRGQMRLEVRRGLTEGTANLFSDDEINTWLDEGARLLTGVAQQYQAIHQITPALRSGSASEYRQEYALPDDVDEVYSVAIAVGGSDILELHARDHRLIQRGVPQRGTPDSWFLKGYVTQYQEHTSSGFTLTDISENKAPHLVIGLHPIPSSASDLIYVHYYSRHFKLETDADCPIVPPEYHRGIIWYAISIGKEKDDAPAEADRAMKKFENFQAELKAKMISRMSQAGFPKVQSPEDDDSYGFLFNVYATDD